MFQALTDGLLALFEGEAQAWVLENLQWADEASLRLLHFISRRVAWGRVLIIGTLWPVSGEEMPAWRGLEEMVPRAGRLTLSGLPLSAIAELTISLFPHLPTEQTHQWATHLQQATGGNPFFVRELLRELIGKESLPENLPVPASVRELVQRRMQFLPSAGLTVLGTLAVLETPATPSRLQRISERLAGETLDALDIGWQRGLLRVEGEQYTFAHDLVREAVAVGLSPARRRWLHTRAAAELADEAARLSLDQRGELVGRILHHALTGDDPERVFAWGYEAAQYAARLNAFGDALQAVQAACEAYPQLPADEAAQPARDQHYLRLLLDKAWLLSLAGHPLAEENQALKTAAALLTRHATPELQGLFHLREAAMLAGEGRYAEATPAALNAYEYFMDLEDRLGAAWSLHSAGRYQITLSQNQVGRQLFAQALELYQASGDIRGEASVLSNLAWVDLNLGEPGLALEGLARALELARVAGDVLAQAEVCNTLAAAWNFFYRGDRVRAYAQEAFTLLGQLGLPNSRARIYLGTAAWVLEGVDAARKEFLQTYEEAVAQNDLWLRGWVAQLLGRVALHQGDLDEAEKFLEEAAALRQKSGERANHVSDLAWLGRLRLARGDVSGALSLTQRAMSEIETLKEEAWVFEAWDVFRTRTEALTVKGEMAEAARYRQLADEAIQRIAAQAPDKPTRKGFLAWVEKK